mmetsp:Transcript_50180/g.98797  ORF Transcript_50180/g.98797 Transcript_50180/m.98797 type:complete len:87 (-) Transcript_50180:127-387(-)
MKLWLCPNLRFRFRLSFIFASRLGKKRPNKAQRSTGKHKSARMMASDKSPPLCLSSSPFWQQLRSKEEKSQRAQNSTGARTAIQAD